ncbi:MAG: cupin domain-containing protein [Acidimicrobiales bacterium]
MAADELWHRYLGDPAVLVLLHPDGSWEQVVLGPDLAAGQQVQVVVPAGTWMGCFVPPGGPSGYVLLGCSMAPGFTIEDYEGGERQALLARYPAAAELVVQPPGRRTAAHARAVLNGRATRAAGPTALPGRAGPRFVTGET